jgi:hypothetical protein
MSKLVEEILKNEIEVLKSKYLPEDTGHLRTAVSVLEERIKELPVSDQAYFTMHNIQLAMMEEFNTKLSSFSDDRNNIWNRQWAIENAIKIIEIQKGDTRNLISLADTLMEYIHKKDVSEKDNKA